MKFHFWAWIVLQFPLLCLASFFNNRGVWHTFETSRFKIHYTDSSRHLVDRVNKNALEAHLKIGKFFNFDPLKELNQKTHIVLITSTDSANGGATPLPQNTIYLFLDLPLEGSSLENYSDYTKSLIFHEYTHIVNLSTKRGYSKILYKIFGNISSPNVLQPIFLTEGFAVWVESNLTGEKTEGRLNSTITDMIFRVAFCENHVPPIDTLPYFIPRWPPGDRPYLYGGALIDSIAKEKGAKTVGELSYVNAGTIPYFINTAAKNTLGKSFYDVYDDFRREKKLAYQTICSRIKKEGHTPFQTLTQNSYYKIALGKWNGGLIWSEYTPDRGSRLKTMPIKNGRSSSPSDFLTTSVFGRNVGGGASVLVFSRLHTDSETNTFSRINIANIETKKRKILKIRDSSGSEIRLRDPFLSPDNTWIAAIRSGILQNSLVTLSLKDGSTFNPEISEENVMIHEALRFPEAFRVGTPKISPDGGRILFTLKYGKGSNIFFYDIKKKSTFRVTSGEHTHLVPDWINTQTIVYSSDESGIFNLYTIDLKALSKKRLTNLIGGAFNPVFFDNTIYFLSYHANGYEVSHLQKQVKPLSVKKSPRPARFSIPRYRTPKFNLSAVDEKPYNSLRHIRPRSWLPLLNLENLETFQIGFFTFGSDPLFRNIYAIYPYYDSQKEKLLFDAYLVNRSLKPVLSMTFSHGYYDYSLSRERKSLSFRAFYPFEGNSNEFQNPFENTVTGVYSGYSLIDDTWKIRSSFAHLGYRRNTRGARAKSVMFENGYYLNFEYLLFNENIDSKYNEHLIRGIAEKYFAISSHIVYKPAIHAGYFTGKDNYFVLGGKELLLISTLPTISPKLRGYRKDSLPAFTYATLTQELHFPILYVYRGWGTFPYFLKNLSGLVSCDTALVRRQRGEPTFFNSISLGITKRFQLGYHFPVKLNFELSRGLRNGGITSFFLTFSGEL